MESEEEREEKRSLVHLCIEAASQSRDAVESWRRERRTLERLPPQIAGALFHRLLCRGLLYPSLLEVFKYSIEVVDLRGENSVDVEWMTYLGGFQYLSSLNVAGCYRITSSALWAVTGMTSLKEIYLSRCSKVTDAGIRHLSSIPTLEKLHISKTGVTAQGVSLLSSLSNLSELDLGGLPVTDQALCSLQVLTKLQYLDLWGSKISNQGVDALKSFPMLSFLNLAWTNVTRLPNLSSIRCLNMSDCTIHSIFEGHGDKTPILKLILCGAMYVDVSEALLFVETNSLSFLDMSSSSLEEFCFLSRMKSLEHLDLSSSLIDDKSVEVVASVGANLRSLNLSKTRVTSAGVGFLSGNVPNLENISLSCTGVDDHAVSYMSLMPSLKVVNLSKTNVKGLIHQVGCEARWIPSLASLQNLISLESLDLEENKIRDEAVHPLSGFPKLSHLSLSTTLLTDESLCLLSSVRKLINLSVRDTVLTNAGLDSFNPPPTLGALDLTGCWLLTKDALLLFCKKHPRIEVRHEFVRSFKFDQSSSKSVQMKQKRGKKPASPLSYSSNTFLDQRLKYSREELLALQFTPLSCVSPRESGNTIPY